MKTIILPGFSIGNEEWAQSVAKDLGTDTVVHKWKHWETSNKADFNVGGEVEAVLTLIGQEKVNILAKSIGTFVAAHLIQKIPGQINKVIFAGVPLKDLQEPEKLIYLNLDAIPSENLLYIQNSADHHGDYKQLVSFFETHKASAKIVEKTAEGHDYPYPEDFKNFLAN